MTKDQLLNDTKEYEYISFDLFDTLMFRTFEKPENVFEAVEYLYNKQSNCQKIENFKKKRHNVEVELRDEYGEKEITIDKIYEMLPYEKSVSGNLEELEKKIEIQNCVPNVPMIEFLCECENRNQKIIITTDMYLDENTIKEILKKIGVNEYVLFLSSKYGTTKKVGKLYERVLDELKIQKKQIVHIGDNLLSDLINPEKYGIKSFKRIKKKNNCHFYQFGNRDIAWNHFNRMCVEKARNINDDEFRLGYNVIGPVIVEFCKWIYKQKKENNAHKIMFVSREGYLIYEIFKSMYPEFLSDIEYVHLNKNILRFPALYIEASPKQFLKTIPNRNEYTMEELLNDLFIDDKVQFMNSFNTNFKLDDKLKKQDILNGKYDEIFERIFYELRGKIKRQHDLFIEYINNLNIQNKNVLLVNNSINGNGQLMLESILNNNCFKTKIIGLQFVASRKCKKALENRYKAWITGNNKIKSRFYTVEFNRYALMFEHLMFSPSGTAMYFEKEADKIEIICHEQGKEKNNNYTINNIQRYALQYEKDSRLYGIYDLGWKSIQLLRKLYKYPYLQDINILKNIYDSDSEGEKKMIYAMQWKQALKKNMVRKKIYNVYIDCYDALKTIISLFKEKIDK